MPVLDTIIEQSVSELSYRLVQDRIDLRPLRILDSRRVEWQGWNVTLHVLGASHAVQFERGDHCITELLTCVALNGAQPALLGLHADRHAEGHAAVHGLCCHVCLTPFPLRSGDALAGGFDAATRMDVQFPGHGGGAPVTRVGWRVAGTQFTIETVHSYPEERRGVRSVSIFTAQEAAREAVR